MSYDFWEQPETQGSRFARRLRMMRVESGLSAESLASRAGVDPVAYRACEAGRGVISAALALRVALALGAPMDEFFYPD